MLQQISTPLSIDDKKLERLKERLICDVRETIRDFLKNEPDQSIPYQVLLKNQFADECEDIANRVLKIADIQHFNSH
mgnify:CR=1 FL=1|tara:strand:- start:241 stop:471 length:231 start_codon:yes stop_codon:yes gene_type:complete